MSDQDISDANERAFPKNQWSDPYKKVRNSINTRGYPKVLVVGASHCTHWASYAKSKYALFDDSMKLANFWFVEVGRAKLENVVDWIQGINLPRKKQ